MLKITKFEERQKKRVKTKQEIENLFTLAAGKAVNNFKEGKQK